MNSFVEAAENSDWGQVVWNGGPPCFHLEGNRFCLRAQRWAGHNTMHAFVPLQLLMMRIAVLVKAGREVVAWDWSDNDADCVADVEALQTILDAIEK